MTPMFPVQVPEASVLTHALFATSGGVIKAPLDHPLECQAGDWLLFSDDAVGLYRSDGSALIRVDTAKAMP